MEQKEFMILMMNLKNKQSNFSKQVTNVKKIGNKERNVSFRFSTIFSRLTFRQMNSSRLEKSYSSLREPF